ncbi:MAG: hypothetical protein RLZZ95_134, partial [Pseudomonadota bacterium]
MSVAGLLWPAARAWRQGALALNLPLALSVARSLALSVALSFAVSLALAMALPGPVSAQGLRAAGEASAVSATNVPSVLPQSAALPEVATMPKGPSEAPMSPS